MHVAGRWEASVPGGGGAAAQTISGNNLRVLEPAAGGGWATRVHIYNTHGE